MISDPWVGVIGLVGLLLLLASDAPVVFCFGLAGVLGSVYFIGWTGATTNLALYGWSQTHSYSMMALPLFILMGEFINRSGYGSDLYQLFYKWTGAAKGGLALATIGACAAFAAMSGSSLSSAVTMGKVAYPEMRRFDYDKKLAAGAICSAGTLAVMIPPSTLFIIYATMTEASVGKLFIAGILPGLLLAAALALTVYIMCLINPKLAPKASHFPWKDKLTALLTGGTVIIMFLLVIGGIYFGWFTAIEGSAIGAFLALALTLSRKKLGWQGMKSSLFDAGKTCCMVFAIIVMANYFGNFLALSRLPIVIADFITKLPVPPIGIVIFIMLVYIPLGCVMEVIAMLALTIPIFFPIIVALGFDPIWFGVLVTLVSELAMITPPVGLIVYAVKGVIPDMTMPEIFAGVMPFVLTMIAVLFVLIFFPQISLYLVGLMH